MEMSNSTPLRTCTSSSSATKGNTIDRTIPERRTCRGDERLHATAHLHLQQLLLVFAARKAGVLKQQQRPAQGASNSCLVAAAGSSGGVRRGPTAH